MRRTESHLAAMIVACIVPAIAAAFLDTAAAAESRGKQNPAICSAVEGLKSRYLAERERAVEALLALAGSDPDAVGGELAHLLDAPDSRPRLMAIRILGRIRYEPVLDRLCAMALKWGMLNLLDQSFVIEALSLFGREAENRMLALGAGETEEGRRILGRIALDDVLAYIKEFYEGAAGTPGWYDGQFDGLKHRGKPAVYALMLLAETYFTGDPPYLKELDGFGIRWHALFGLGEFGDKDALVLLRRVVREVDSALAHRQNALGNRSLDEEATRAAQTAAAACYKIGDREPLLERIRDIRSRIDGRVRSNPRSHSEGEYIASLYWDLALSLAPLEQVEDVVDAYKKNMYWRKRSGIEPERYAIGHYNIACAYSRAKRLPEALNAYLDAVKNGYDDIAWTMRDGDLAAVREMPEFQLALGYIPLRQLSREESMLSNMRAQKISQALARVNRSVDNGLRDPKWFDDPRFFLLRTRPGFWWCAARVQGRAGDAARVAESLLEFYGLSGLADDDGLDPSALEKSPDLDPVRDDPRVRKALDLLRGRG